MIWVVPSRAPRSFSEDSIDFVCQACILQSTSYHEETQLVGTQCSSRVEIRHDVARKQEMVQSVILGATNLQNSCHAVR